ncbi:hypothetical protein WN943_010298 [Citrus x changshan-huyou]
MEFDSDESAYDFYNAYGLKVGSNIRKETFGKNKCTGEITSRQFVCAKASLRSKDKRDYLTIKPRAETRIDCGAQLCVKLDRNKNKFFVNHFVESHNHPLVMEECTHMLPSQRRISSSQAMEVDLANESRISLKSNFELIVKQASGRESLGYTRLDQKNYLE